MPGHADITTGLVGWWKLDEGSGINVADSSGNNNKGTLTNSPTWVGGHIGSAVNLDGSTQYIQVGDSNSLDITDQLTIAGWVWVAASGTDIQNQYLLDKQNLYSLLVEDNETISFYASNLNNVILTTTDTISMQAWHHIAVTYDKDAGANNTKIYIDGSLSAQETRTNALGIDANVLRLGCYSNSGGACNTNWAFNGKIDDVRIYNRALSSEDIQTLYRFTGHKAKISGGAHIGGGHF